MPRFQGFYARLGFEDVRRVFDGEGGRLYFQESTMFAPLSAPNSLSLLRPIRVLVYGWTLVWIADTSEVLLKAKHVWSYFLKMTTTYQPISLM